MYWEAEKECIGRESLGAGTQLGVELVYGTVCEPRDGGGSWRGVCHSCHPVVNSEHLHPIPYSRINLEVGSLKFARCSKSRRHL